MATSDGGLTDQGRLLFGAGFVFGVTATLLVLSLVLVVVTNVGGQSITSSPVATLAGGVLFTTIVGIGLTYLAFPENRTRVAVDPALFGLEDEE